MTAYYNENEPHAVRCLKDLVARRLIPPGDVDDRSVVDVRAPDLAGYTQCHFFAGVAGWPLALDLARWPRERQVWTGSCPCGPFSVAGKRKGFDDSRHLWPVWFNLIRECRPPIIFGEQVAAAPEWLRLVRGDLEAVDYAVGAMPIEAACAGAPHRRERYFFVADASGRRQQGHLREAQAQAAHDLAPEALGAWDAASGPFSDWRKLLGQSAVRGVVDGVSSYVDIRPRLHAFGNAINPQVAAVFVSAAM